MFPKFLSSSSPRQYHKILSHVLIISTCKCYFKFLIKFEYFSFNLKTSKCFIKGLLKEIHNKIMKFKKTPDLIYSDSRINYIYFDDDKYLISKILF